MNRYTRYVNRPAFGVAAGIFIVLSLGFAFANIFHWVPPIFQPESLAVRIILGVLVIAVWVLLNIPPPKLNNFVIVLAQLVEEREQDGALYGALHKTRPAFWGKRDTHLENWEGGMEEFSTPSIASRSESPRPLENSNSQQHDDSVSFSALAFKPVSANATIPLSLKKRPSSFEAADGSATGPIPEHLDGSRTSKLTRPVNFPAKTANWLDDENTTVSARKKFVPPPLLWKQAYGPRPLTTFLKKALEKELKAADVGDTSLYDTDGFVSNRDQALREGEYPKAKLIIWGWNVYGTAHDFVPVFELLEPLETRLEQHKMVQIVGLKSFELGQQTAKESTIYAAFVSGLAAYAQQRYDKAQNEFSMALIAAAMYAPSRKLDFGTDRAIIYFFLGNTCYYLHDYEKAVSCYREALGYDLHLFEARQNLGVCLYLQNKMDLAVKRFIEVIQLKPSMAVARYNLGMAYLRKKQLSPARRELNNTVRLNSQFAGALRGLGLCMSQDGSFDHALNYFRQALEIDPKFAEIHVDIALLYYGQAEPVLNKKLEAERELRQAEQGRDQALISEARQKLGKFQHWNSEQRPLLEKANPELQKALSINPNLAEAHYYMGLILLQQNQEDQAGQSLLDAVKLKPDYADAYEVLADIYEARGRNDLRDKYLKLMGEARSASSANSAEALIKTGISLRLNRQLPQARDALEKALKLEPRNPKALFELGNVFHEQEDYEQALAMFQSVLKFPDPPDEIFENISRIYRQQGREAEANKIIENAASRKPSSAKLQYYLGNSLRRRQNNAQATEAYQQAISLEPTLADARFNLGLINLSKRQLQDAALQFSEVVRLRPDDSTTYRYLGRAYVEMKQIDEAVEAFKKAVEIKTDSLQARMELGQIFLARSEAEEAKEQFETILKYDPNNLRARELLGKAFAQSGQIDMAMETFQNMLLVNPDSHAAHYNLGVALASEKRYEEAIREFRQVLHIRSDDADAYFNLGLAHDKLDQPYESIDAFQRAIKLRPTYAEAYRYLGQVYFKINDMTSGLKAVHYSEQLKKV